MRHPLALLSALVLLLSLFPRAPAARASQHPITAQALPAQGGAATEVRTEIDAPAEQVAAVAGDPAHFSELLPADEVRVIGRDGAAVLVDVVRREPWPVGALRWTESVLRRRGPGGAYVIERQARGPGVFRRFAATWTITPLPGARCAVSYRVSIEMQRWVPAWMMRRGNQTGMVDTMNRLRHLSERLISRAD